MAQKLARGDDAYGLMWEDQDEAEHRRLKLPGFDYEEKISSSDEIGEGEHIKVLLEFARRHPRTGDFDSDKNAREAIIAAWNDWVKSQRDRKADFVPNLWGLNGDAKAWKSTALWSYRRKTVPYEQFFLARIDLRGACLVAARLENAVLIGATLEKADAREARFHHALLRECNLRGALLHFASLEDTSLRWANIESAELNLAILDRAIVQGIHYRRYSGIWPFRRDLMLGHYLGIRGVEACYGEPEFRRDALDQDFIDQKFRKARLVFSANPIEHKWLGWFLNSQPLRTIRSIYWTELHERIPRRLLFWLWSLSDYGRSTLGVMLYVAATIGMIGALYEWILIPQQHSVLTGSSAGLPFAAWYAAGMGAATLGLTELMKPLDVWGQLALFGNALAGLVLFGMLVAVLQNKVARRS